MNIPAATDKSGAPAKVALTGGIGSGKSTALAMFAARGAAVLDTDQVVHGLLDRKEVLHQVAHDLCIDEIPAGEEGRRVLAEVVFRDDKRLERLEEILFPLVREEVERWLESDAVTAAPMAVVEVPMLFESGMEKQFDCLVLITAPPEVRKLRHEGTVTLTDFERRASRQLPEPEKQDRCHYVFDNSGPPDELDDFVARTFYDITGRKSGELT